MRRAVRVWILLVTAVVLPALGGCKGNTGDQGADAGDGDGGCPPSASVTSGAPCTRPADLECSGPEVYDSCLGEYIGEQPCSCWDGAWVCFALSEPACEREAGPVDAAGQ